MRKHFSAAALILVLLVSACSDPDSSRPDSGREKTGAAPVEGRPVVDVIMTEYAYNISGPMAAGGTMRVQNIGEEMHMIGTGRLRPGKTVKQVTEAFEQEGDPEEALESLLDEVEGPMGGTYAPGTTVELTIPDFGEGNYVFLCFLPSVGDGAPHLTKGMVGEFIVGTGETEIPTPDTTYKLTSGQPIEGPETLTAGRHVIEIEAAEGSEELEPSFMKFAEGKTYADLDVAFEQVFGEDPPKPGYAAELPVSDFFFLHDLAGVRRLFVAVDLEPGDYLMTANDSDTGEPVTDPTEKIAIKVS